MFIHEYGSRDNPTILLMAPMMASGADLYSLMAPHLTGEYHLIAPDQGEHGQAGQYQSADQEYKDLKSYLLEIGCTQIHLLYGASLGVAVAYRLFFDNIFTVSYLCVSKYQAKWITKETEFQLPLREGSKE